MAKKNTKTLGVLNNKKAVPQKKESKKEKLNFKKIKKQQVALSQQSKDQQQVNDEEASNANSEDDSQQNEEISQGSSEDGESDQDQDSEQQSSQQSLAPQDYAIKQMQFRQRRGTKMNYLMNRRKQEEQDSFWQKQGQDYFGDLQDQQGDQDYQQSSSGRDQFDSDFNQTQSEHEQKQNQVQQPQVDQQRLKEKRKHQQLMRKIEAPAAKKLTAKTSASNKKNQTQKKTPPEPLNRYIHQVCTQEQLLGEAAQTQYINWLSLQKLISIQNERKDFATRQHILEGQKVIFRDRFDQTGKRSVSYELVGVSINKIQDLTQLLNKQDSQ